MVPTSSGIRYDLDMYKYIILISCISGRKKQSVVFIWEKWSSRKRCEIV